MRCLSSTRPGFLKQGKASCGVARRYTGSAGKITNCQVGVFAAYVSRRGHAFIDRALYLPKAWTSDPARMAAAHVPTGTAFATKPALAVHMIARAIAVEVAFAGVAADSVYRVGDVEQALRKAGKGYVLGVNSNHHFRSWTGKPSIAGTANEPALATGSRKAWIRLRGIGYRRTNEPRVPDCTTWPISSSPTSTLPNTMRPDPACGRVVS